jgi:type II secretory ATPase GspE/PulE/Tfp pilus assembly ATPase PilB-like protein
VNEAIAMWRKLVANDKVALSQLKMVVSGRVVRKLCPACKVGYNPDPNQLRKMNMDPGAVTQLFQARTQPMRNDKGEVIPCTFCNELRFSGRVGVFEVLVVDDDVRTALASGSANQLKAAFRKQKGKYLQEAALEVVERGDTSVQEVLRVLRGPDQQKPPSQQSAEPVEV